MCGITGYITTKPNYNNARAFKALILANEKRGGQSAGVYTSANNTILKKAVNPFDFIATIDDNILATSKLVLGHTRLATTGAIKDANAHPFNYGAITGVHNGIVYNFREVLPNARVDSEAIFYQLNKSNNNAKKALKKLSGLFAIAWTNGQGDLMLVRDGEPLAIANVDNTLYFNSELNTLTAILYATYGKPITAQELPEETMLTIKPNLTTTTQPIKFKESYMVQNYGGRGKMKWADDTQNTYPSDIPLDMVCDKCGFACIEAKSWTDVNGAYVFCNKCYDHMEEGEQEELFPLGGDI